MTEIPEHLLQRSRERRAALGLGGDAPAPASGGGESASPAPAAAAATPATTGGGAGQPPATPAVPAEPKPEPPKPVPAHVQAAYNRRRIPMWAMPVLAALPLWSYVYVRTLEPRPVENDPVELGAELYAGNCASCHGGTGLGQGPVPALTDVAATWPDFRDHLYWVKGGEDGWPGESYGGQPRTKISSTMPAFGSMTEQEIAQVVLHEREAFADIDVEADEPDLLAIANGEMTFAEAGVGELSDEAGISESDLGG